jgi:hypothetical protein
MGECGCTCQIFLDLSTSWRWLVSFTPRPVYPRERAYSTHWIGGWVGPRDGLEKIKFLTLPDTNSDPSFVQLIASRNTDWAIPARHVLSRSNEISRYVTILHFSIYPSKIPIFHQIIFLPSQSALEDFCHRHSVLRWKSTDVSAALVVSINRVEDETNQEAAGRDNLKSNMFLNFRISASWVKFGSGRFHWPN